jgi:hypothetical protein
LIDLNDLNVLNPWPPEGDIMKGFTAIVFLAVLVVIPLASSIQAAELDRAAVDFKTPGEIKWVRNAAGTNESAVLFGDPTSLGHGTGDFHAGGKALSEATKFCYDNKLE